MGTQVGGHRQLRRQVVAPLWPARVAANTVCRVYRGGEAGGALTTAAKEALTIIEKSVPMLASALRPAATLDMDVLGDDFGPACLVACLSAFLRVCTFGS